MRLGIDFDNTIVCYDALFHRVALEGGWIPAELPANKADVRNHLRAIGREEIWTEMQGTVYGARILEAEPYPGVHAFFATCRAAEIPVYIISHKTRHPFLGERHDLHAAALGWLERQGFFDPAQLGLPRENAFFERTKQAKLERIARCGCTQFVDDLPEFLAEPSFPPGVERILFDPNGVAAGETRFHRFGSWADLTRHIGIPIRAASQTLSQVEQSFVRRTLGGAPGLEADRLAAEPLPGGANNRVWRVHCGPEAFVLKCYFHNPADPRDRFGAERAFYEWTWSRGVRRTPEPVGWDPDEQLGLFRFVAGRKLRPDEVNAGFVDQAVAFVAELNADRAAATAQAIPVASEACFTIADHLACIDHRVRRLAGLTPQSPKDHEAAAWVREDLEPAWGRTAETITGRADRSDDKVLATCARCLSPSDFGFHNALLPGDGRLRFLDFEYAGWDDPAKLICDFFCQPQVPVPAAHWLRVTGGLDRVLGWRGALPARAALLLPAYRVKWCCILLNEFLRDERARRDYAQGGGAGDERKRAQLAKARAALAAVRPIL